MTGILGRQDGRGRGRGRGRARFANVVPFALALLALGVSILMVPLTSAQAQGLSRDYFRVVGVASWDALNVRAAPSSRAGIKGAIPARGFNVERLANGANGWMLVRYGRLNGWVNRRYLRGMIEQGAGVGPRAWAAVVGVAPYDVLHMRAWPGARSRVVARLPAHAYGVAIVRHHPTGWALVRHRGAQGWVNARFLRPLR
ncbi:MAG: hypothetical protein AAFR04_07855 [Pseudomonadota bacterium]